MADGARVRWSDNAGSKFSQYVSARGKKNTHLPAHLKKLKDRVADLDPTEKRIVEIFDDPATWWKPKRFASKPGDYIAGTYWKYRLHHQFI